MHAEVLPFHASLTVVPYQRKDERTDNFHSEIYSSGNTFNTSELPLTLELCGTLFKPLNFSLSVSLSYCLTQPLQYQLGSQFSHAYHRPHPYRSLSYLRTPAAPQPTKTSNKKSQIQYSSAVMPSQRLNHLLPIPPQFMPAP